MVQHVGPGMAFRSLESCSLCGGSGKVIKEKDRCKKCKGRKTMESRKPLELYIPPGSMKDDKVVLKGEADQTPGQDPGDIIFKLVEIPHKTFHRVGSDLYALFEVSLSEALTGFDRTVLIHLDGHGIKLTFPRFDGDVLRPSQALKVSGEGMPIKGKDTKGDLYLTSNIIFPENGWLKTPDARQQLKTLLPDNVVPKTANTEREVEYELYDDTANASDKLDSEDSDSEHTNPTCVPQ